MPPTWQQKTPRGTHRLYRLPAGFTGKNSRFPAGDLKVRGYLVGPGSEVDGTTYFMLDEQQPVEAPKWLLDLVSEDRPSTTLVNGELVFNERDKIKIGENDTELFSLACNFRRRGFNEAAISALLWGIVHSGVVEQIPGNEYHEKDIRRLAKQAARYDPVTGELTLGTDAWQCAADIPLVGPPVDWWVHGFIPRGELVTLYGRGGIGKSSWASWLAGEVTRRGGKFIFIGVEESFTRFAARAVLGGADRKRLYCLPDAGVCRVPRDVEKLRSGLTGLGDSNQCVLYFDSIYSHFESTPGDNAAERARRCLGPLAGLAAAAGTTVIATFHENKAGTYLGSTEMINVARYALRAQREGRTPLRVWVEKTNFVDPGCAMQFEAHDTELRDPETQQVQYEVKEDGELVPMVIKVLSRIADCSQYEEVDEDEGADRIKTIASMLESDPEMPASKIYRLVGGRKSETLAAIRSLRPAPEPEAATV